MRIAFDRGVDLVVNVSVLADKDESVIVKSAVNRKTCFMTTYLGGLRLSRYTRLYKANVNYVNDFDVIGFTS